MAWSFVFVNVQAKAELDALPADMRAGFERIVQLVRVLGLERVHESHIKHLDGPIWEMRLRGKDGIARALYMAMSEQPVVILHTFVKKSQKTPRRAIDLAYRRAQEIE